MSDSITREEQYLNAIANGESIDLTPITREELFLAKAAGQDVKTPTPITRREIFLSKISGGGGSQPSGENKLAQIVDRSITEITAQDLEGITTIGQRAFAYCKNLINVAIPEGVTKIDYSAFEKCTNLKKWKLPSSLTTIESGAIYDTNIEETYFEGELWQWCNKMYSGLNTGNFGDLYIKGQLLENLIFEPTPEAYQGKYDTTYIREYSFLGCSSLKTVSIRGASNRYYIGNYAFFYCKNLTRVEIGTKKFGSDYPLNTSLPSYLFYDCPNLTDIYVCWSEGEISGAPWGASNAQIHYNSHITEGA